MTAPLARRRNISRRQQRPAVLVSRFRSSLGGEAAWSANFGIDRTPALYWIWCGFGSEVRM